MGIFNSMILLSEILIQRMESIVLKRSREKTKYGDRRKVSKKWCDFLWNSGMFIWKARVILQEIEKHIPELGEQL